MPNTRVLGILLVVMGGMLVVSGLRSSKSATSQLSEAFNNRPTRETSALLLGGLVEAGVGVWLLLKSKK